MQFNFYLKLKFFELLLIFLIPIVKGNDCIILENIVNLIGNDLQKNYYNQTLNSCCEFNGVICEHINNENHIIKIQFNNYDFSKGDFYESVNQINKFEYLTSLEIMNSNINNTIPKKYWKIKKIGIFKFIF